LLNAGVNADTILGIAVSSLQFLFLLRTVVSARAHRFHSQNISCYIRIEREGM